MLYGIIATAREGLLLYVHLKFETPIKSRRFTTRFGSPSWTLVTSRATVISTSQRRPNVDDALSVQPYVHVDASTLYVCLVVYIVMNTMILGLRLESLNVTFAVRKGSSMLWNWCIKVRICSHPYRKLSYTISRDSLLFVMTRFASCHQDDVVRWLRHHQLKPSTPF